MLLCYYHRFFFLILPPPPRSTLFPYTTLFRSHPTRTRAPRRRRRGSATGTRARHALAPDRKSTRLNSSHEWISYAVFCLKKKKNTHTLRMANKNIQETRGNISHLPSTLSELSH